MIKIKILNLFKRKKINPELITEYDLLNAIKEKLSDKEFEIFLKNEGHKMLNSMIFFYNGEKLK